MNSLLKPALNFFSRYIVKDSFEYVVELKHQKANDIFLFFFEVKSLFTNVPLNEVIDICANTLYSLDNPIRKITSFILLIKLATKKVEFSFNNVLYRQVDRIAIGSHLGPK